MNVIWVYYASLIGVFLMFLVLLIVHLRQRIEGFYQFAAEDTTKCFGGAYTFHLPDFLTPQQCDELVASSLGKGMDESQVGEVSSSLDLNVRNSTQTWYKPEHHHVAQTIRDKVAHMISTDPRIASCFRALQSRYSFEDIQVVRYGTNGKYDPHFDATECGDDVGVKCSANQRIATVLIYLNDGFEGGHTRFPHLDVSVTPKKGSAIFFWVSDATGNSPYVYEKTLHGGDPVLTGEKWIATQWIRSA
jgi:prolyl 4-hydroxylase